MKKNFPKKLKNLLLSSIQTISNNKELYLRDPEKNFSRKQKISFEDTMMFPIVTSKYNTAKEMADFFPETQLPSQAALSYRRDQIKLAAYQDLFYTFTSQLPQDKHYKEMLAIACDGTRANTPYNTKDADSFVDHTKDKKGFNQCHLNTLYDLLNDVYVDVAIQNFSSMNETAAFCEMIDRFPKNKPALFIADRGYAAFNVIAHILNNGHHFLIRTTTTKAQSFFDNVKEFDDNTSFEIEDVIHIGRTRSNSARNHRNYHFLKNTITYDFIPPKSKDIDMFHVRLVKITLPGGGSEYLITDLPSTVLSLDEIKELYHLRWNVETSYRFLKYATELIHFHSLKQEFIFQEIYAKLICYNFCASIYRKVEPSTTKETKHKYRIEKTYLIQCTIEFLKGKVKDLVKLVEKRKVPVRAGRSFERNVRRQHADTLQNR